MNIESKQKRIAFGYNRDSTGQIELHPGQEAAVKLIFQMYEDGDSLNKIAQTLQSIGAPSPQNKSLWGRQEISRVCFQKHNLTLYASSIRMHTEYQKVSGECAETYNTGFILRGMAKNMDKFQKSVRSEATPEVVSAWG